MMRCCLLFVLVAIAGCGSNSIAPGPDPGKAKVQDDAKVVGAWGGKFVMDNGKTIPGADLTLDKEHHFRELYKNLEVLGTWKLDGDSVILSVQSLGGKPIAQAQKEALELAKKQHNAALQTMAENMNKDVPITLSADGKTLTARPDPGAQGHAVFTKQP